MKSTRFADLCIGIGYTALGAGAFAYSTTLPTANTGLGSGGYPMVIAAIMVVLGLAQTGTALSEGVPRASFRVDVKSVSYTAAVVLSSFAYTMLVRYIGFLFLTPFLLFGLMMLFGYKNLKVAAIVSICASTVTYLVFSKAFMVFLPEFNLF